MEYLASLIIKLYKFNKCMLMIYRIEKIEIQTKYTRDIFEKFESIYISCELQQWKIYLSKYKIIKKSNLQKH